MAVAFLLGRASGCVADECLRVKPLAHAPLAAAGLLASLISLVFFALVRPESGGARYTQLQRAALALADDDDDDGCARPNGHAEAKAAQKAAAAGDAKEEPRARARLRGVLLSLFAGGMYGVRFLPCAIYGQLHGSGDTLLVQLRVTFAQYVGSFVAAVAAYGVYACRAHCRGDRVALVPQAAMVPSVVSGVVWACGTIGALVALDRLGYGVGYAVCSNGCFLVAGAWSVGWYREIQARFVDARSRLFWD